MWHRQENQRSNSLWTVITRYYIFLVFIPFICLVVILSLFYTGNSRKTYGSHILRLLNAGQDQLAVLKKTYNQISFLPYYNKVVDRLEEISSDKEKYQETKNALQNMLNSYTNVDTIILKTSDTTMMAGQTYGDCVAAVSVYDDQILARNGRSDWYGPVYLQPVRLSGYKFVIARSLHTATTRNAGILYLLVDIRRMQSVMDNMAVEDSAAYLLNDAGHVMNSTDLSAIGKDMDFAYPAGRERSGYYQGQVDQRKCLIVYSQSYKTGWTLVETIPVREIYTQATPVIITLLIMSVLYIAAIISMIFVLRRKVLVPIQNLSDRMDSFSLNDETKMQRADGRKLEEIGRLEQHYQDLTRRVVLLVSENEKRSREEAELQIKALTAQLSPHFVYNALNTIKWMAVINKQKNIGAMIGALNKIMLNNVNSGKPYHTIREEIDLIESYALIQRARFMNFTISYQIQEGADQIMIRRFLLQPLIENSIVHGFQRGQARNGRIQVDITFEEQLLILIRDNGAGFDVEQWRQSEHRTEDTNTGIALSNIENIIALEYGAPYGMTIESSPGKGTKVTLILPADPKADGTGGAE